MESSEKIKNKNKKEAMVMYLLVNRNNPEK